MNMENDEQGPMENLLDGLDRHSDSLSFAELKAELRDRGIDLDAGLERAQATIATYDKQDRLGWMKEADEKAASLRVAESPGRSWTGAKAEEIVSAFKAYITSAKPETALAFRNKGELSVEDMAQILDANERLKHRSEEQDESRS
jgi:hypothetical protein